MNILLVDDSRFLRLANERALTKAGHNVISGSDGDEGLRLALERKPDLVVLDMMLPKLSGADVLRATRKDPATSSIPVMVLTSLPQCNEESCWAKAHPRISKSRYLQWIRVRGHSCKRLNTCSQSRRRLRRPWRGRVARAQSSCGRFTFCHERTRLLGSRYRRATRRHIRGRAG